MPKSSPISSILKGHQLHLKQSICANTFQTYCIIKKWIMECVKNGRIFFFTNVNTFLNTRENDLLAQTNGSSKQIKQNNAFFTLVYAIESLQIGGSCDNKKVKVPQFCIFMVLRRMRVIIWWGQFCFVLIWFWPRMQFYWKVNLIFCTTSNLRKFFEVQIKTKIKLTWNDKNGITLWKY